MKRRIKLKLVNWPEAWRKIRTKAILFYASYLISSNINYLEIHWLLNTHFAPGECGTPPGVGAAPPCQSPEGRG